MVYPVLSGTFIGVPSTEPNETFNRWFFSKFTNLLQRGKEQTTRDDPKLALIAETCRRYDWDGLEIDWQRHPFHLPQEHAYRLRYALTDLQRAVRQVTEEVAARRGRPFYLAARVAGTLEMSRSIGYDVPAWTEEGLVDMLIPAGGYGMDPAIDVAGYL